MDDSRVSSSSFLPDAGSAQNADEEVDDDVEGLGPGADAADADGGTGVPGGGASGRPSSVLLVDGKKWAPLVDGCGGRTPPPQPRSAKARKVKEATLYT